ncbi:MAG: N-acetylglucosamine kinase [Hyphomicrobiales bacterium]|nr:N-acetylglucosamine kinase [Hyphomicrobiales bacterium]
MRTAAKAITPGQMLFMGVDGGGTSCRARIRSPDGACLAESQGGAANIYQDFAGAIAVIMATAQACADKAGVPLQQLHAGFGLAGVTDPKQGARVQAAGLPFARLRVESDSYIACLGAHGGGDGGIVIAGTGSAGLALIEGARRHIGGHGFMLGDPGSGAVIGRAALREALLCADGLHPATPLTDALMARFDHDTTAVVEWSRTALSRDYAQFAPLVVAAANAGDAIATPIIMQAVHDLGAIARRLKALGAPRISLIGSFGTALLPFFERDLAVLFEPPLADPLDGAIAMVQK